LVCRRGAGVRRGDERCGVECDAHASSRIRAFGTIGYRTDTRSARSGHRIATSYTGRTVHRRPAGFGNRSPRRCGSLAHGQSDMVDDAGPSLGRRRSLWAESGPSNADQRPQLLTRTGVSKSKSQPPLWGRSGAGRTSRPVRRVLSAPAQTPSHTRGESRAAGTRREPCPSEWRAQIRVCWPFPWPMKRWTCAYAFKGFDRGRWAIWH
jgi:hypothetical protein